jgi:hypothetical protein
MSLKVVTLFWTVKELKILNKKGSVVCRLRLITMPHNLMQSSDRDFEKCVVMF